MRILSVIVVLATSLAACSKTPTAEQPLLIVYKSPTCGCCTKWMEHVNAHGLKTQAESQQDMVAVQTRMGVPAELQSCHVAVAGEYLIVGHVPAGDIQRLLTEKPKARGLSVSGMPVGSPGMEHGDQHQPYDTILFQADGQTSVFAQHGE